MERSPRRLAVLVAALPVAAALVWPAGPARHQDAPVVTAGPEPVSDQRSPAATGPTLPAAPRSGPDCFPIGRVEPLEPGAVPFPGTSPTVPGPVPIPEVTITCDSDLLAPR